MLTTANLITVFRIALVPAFSAAFLYMAENPILRWVVFCLFTLAAVLDAVDGFVARAFRQKSAVGAFLDPLADKLLVTMVYLLGVPYGIPLYVTVAVISRDVLIVLGWALLHYFGRDAGIRPLWISKVNTACQFITAGLFLLDIALYYVVSVPDVILRVAFLTTLVTTVVSGAACFVEWYKRMGGFTRV